MVDAKLSVQGPEPWHQSNRWSTDVLA